MEIVSVIVRIFVDAPRQRAEAIREELRSRFDRASRSTVEPYPKFDGWHSISVRFRGRGTPPEAIRAAAKALGTGWKLKVFAPDDYTSYGVWNPGPDADLGFAEARFGDLQLIGPRET